MKTNAMGAWAMSVFFFLITGSVNGFYEQEDIRVRPESACEGLVGRLLTVCKGEPVYAVTDGGVVALYPADSLYYTRDGWWRVYVPFGVRMEEARGWGIVGPQEQWIVRTWVDGGLVAQKVENFRGIVGVEEDARTGKAVVYITHPAVSAVKKHGNVEYGTTWRAYTSQQLAQELRERVNEVILRGHRAFGEDKTVISGWNGLE